MYSAEKRLKVQWKVSQIRLSSKVQKSTSPSRSFALCRTKNLTYL